jgi:hypothetical protein
MCLLSQATTGFGVVEDLAKLIYLGRWRNSFIAMFGAYFDASGHPDDTSVFTVAGFVADATQWTEFERNWNEILTRPDFQVSALHMKDFCHSTGDFAGWKGDERRRRNFLSALIGTIKLRARHAFAQSIYMPDYREIDKVYKLSERAVPLVYCGASCVAKVGSWAHRWGIPIHEVAFFFEDGDKDRQKLAAEVHALYGININFLKKWQSVAFQAADLLAYEHFRANQKVIPQPVGSYALEDLRHPFQELLKVASGGEEGDDLTVTERKCLEQFCAEQKLPLR